MPEGAVAEQPTEQIAVPGPAVRTGRTGAGALLQASRSRAWAWPLAVAALAVAGFLVWLPSLDLPLDVDPGGYATAAYWWARGDTLYREITITRPQGIFVVFRTIEALGLGSVRGIHLFAALCSVLGALLLLAVAGRAWGRAVGWGAAALYAGIMATPYLQGNTANAELFMLPPLLGALYLLVRADERPLASRAGLGLVAGCGLLTAVALLVKPSALAGLPLAALWLAWRWRLEQLPWRDWLAGEAALALGFVAGLLPALAHGLATAPEHYLDAVLLYRVGQDSAVSGRWLYQFSLFVAHSAAILVQLPVLLAAAVGFWAARRDRRGRDLLWLWTLTSLGGVALGGNWWFHYYQQLLPPLAVAAALGLRALWLARPGGHALAGAVCRALAVVAVGSFLATLAWLMAPPADPAKLLLGYHPESAWSGAVADYVRARTTPDERIYVVYHEPEIYYLAQRRPAARWLYFRELGRTPGAFDEQVARLADPATAPRYVIAAQPFDAFLLDREGKLRAVVERDYELETTIGGIPIYRRR